MRANRFTLTVHLLESLQSKSAIEPQCQKTYLRYRAAMSENAQADLNLRRAHFG